MIPVFGEMPPESVVRARRAAYALITDNAGRIAVVKGPRAGPRCYWLPGGGREAGETVAQAICREVVEELGRHARGMVELGEAVEVFFSEEEECWFRMEAVFVRAELGGDSDTPPEHEVEWIEPDRARDALFHASHVWAVQKLM